MQPIERSWADSIRREKDSEATSNMYNDLSEPAIKIISANGTRIGKESKSKMNEGRERNREHRNESQKLEYTMDEKEETGYKKEHTISLSLFPLLPFLFPFSFHVDRNTLLEENIFAQEREVMDCDGRFACKTLLYLLLFWSLIKQSTFENERKKEERLKNTGMNNNKEVRIVFIFFKKKNTKR